jgi:hypothetical protein
VGLYSNGNVIEGGSPNAAQINFCQDVRLLKDLIEGNAAGRVPGYRASWRDIVADARLPPEQVVASRLAEFRREFGASVVTLVDENATLDKPEPAYRGQLATEYRFRIEANTTYLAIVSSRERAAFSLHFIDRESGTILESAVPRATVAILDVAVTKSTDASLWILSEAMLPDGRPDTSPVEYDLKLLSGR